MKENKEGKMCEIRDFGVQRLQNITIIKMALLTAGKQISVGGQNSYGKGLFLADPEEAERKARKQEIYQEELRSQMEQDRKRKDDLKRREQEDDIRLEQKINEELNRQKNQKQEKTLYSNDKNYTAPASHPSPPPPPQHQRTVPLQNSSQAKSQIFSSAPPRAAYQEHQYQVETPYNYKFNMHMATEGDSSSSNPFMPQNFSLIQAEEQRFFEESSNQKLRGMHEALEQKLNEVHRRIKMSQDLEVDKEFDIIRKKIASSNASSDHENYRAEELQGEMSHFYRIPKRSDNYGSSQVSKNLDYSSNSYMKRTNNLVKPVTQHRIATDREVMSRESRNSNDDRLWGAKKGKSNFLGNRQAMDFQINSMLGKIDNLLQDQDYR